MDILPLEGIVRSESGVKRLEPVTMNVLLTLVKRAGDVVTRDEIMNAVWKHQNVSDESVTRCISELRAAFGDSARNSSYIETVPKRGYRLIAPVAGRKREQPPDIPEPGSFGIGRMTTPKLLFALVGGVISVAVLWWFLSVPALDAGRVILLPASATSAAIDEMLLEEVLDSIRLSLSRKGLEISSRQTASALSSQPSEAIARQLRARWLVESSFGRRGDLTHVTLSLIDGQSQFAVLHEQYYLEENPEQAAEDFADAVQELLSSDGAMPL